MAFLRQSLQLIHGHGRQLELNLNSVTQKRLSFFNPLRLMIRTPRLSTATMNTLLTATHTTPRKDKDEKVQKQSAIDVPRQGYGTKYLFDQFTSHVQPLHLQGFLNTIPDLVSDLLRLEEFGGSCASNDRIRKLIEYNLLPSTQFCGTQVLASNEFYTSQNSNGISNSPEILSSQNLFEASVLGWCSELMIASPTVLDDLVDGSKMRYGQPCWYLQDSTHNQNNAGVVFDALILERAAYAILKRYFEGNANYIEYLHTFSRAMTCNYYAMAWEIELNTIYKQTGRLCSLEDYCKMRQWQNGYLIFYLPNAAAAILNGVANRIELQQLERSALDIGLQLSIMKDLIDGFGDPAYLGSEGTDIINGRITCLLLTALEHANTRQRSVIQANIGKPFGKNVALVLDMYKEIGVPNILEEWTSKIYEEAKTNIANISPRLPQRYLESLLGIFKNGLKVF